MLDIIHISPSPLYVMDAKVNDVNEPEDENGQEVTPKMPFLVKEGKYWRWNLDIDIDTGNIQNWPKGVTAKTWYKISDMCRIKYGDKEYEEYVPDFLSPSRDGYGDYIYMDIDEDGHIKKWSTKKCRIFIKNEM